MSVLTRELLEESRLADLHAIASELSIDGYRRLRKDDLIDAILNHQGATQADADAADSGVDTEPSDSGVDTEPSDSGIDADAADGAARRRRGRRGGRARAGANGPVEEQAGSVPESPRPDVAGPERSGRTKAGRPATDDTPVVEGTVELLANGSAFLRLAPPARSEDDVYISAAQVKRCELINGDRVSGPRRAAHRSERFASLVRVDTVNGRPAEDTADRGRFDDLAAEFPKDRFQFGSGDATLSAIEDLTPFGRGSRVAITGGSWTGKSQLLKELARALSAQDDVTVIVALVGVRPEELSEWNTEPIKVSAALSFSASAEAQDNAVDMVVDQARRLAMRGSHAVVLLDTLDGLHPLNARRALASARKLKDGGSVTVVATSTRPLGGETTVIALDANFALAGRRPALDLQASGTLRAELLIGSGEAKTPARQRVKAHK
ncbi:MAG: Rho termination factor N-terminal domain-containing protein [Solirubrobacteraceae bacterium]